MATTKQVLTKACALALTGVFFLTACGDPADPPASLPNQSTTTSNTATSTPTNNDPIVESAEQATESVVDKAKDNLDAATATNGAAQDTEVQSCTRAEYEAALKAAAEAAAAVEKATADYNTAVANRDTLAQAVASDEAQMAKTNKTVKTSTPIDWDQVDEETTAKVVESIVYAKINEYRMNQGLPALAYTESGSEEARQWSQTMDEAGHIYHADLTEVNASAENVLVTYYGENVWIQDPKRTDSSGNLLIYENTSPEELANDIFRLWKNSAGHDRIMLLSYPEAMSVGVYFGENAEVYATMREYASYNNRSDYTVLPDPETEYGVTTVSQDTESRGAYTGTITPSTADNVSGLPTTDLTPDLHATQETPNPDFTELESKLSSLETSEAAAESEVTDAKTELDKAQAAADAADATVDRMEAGEIVDETNEAASATVDTEAAAAEFSAADATVEPIALTATEVAQAE